MEIDNLKQGIITGDPIGQWEQCPEDWHKYKLWDIAEYINGRAFKPTDFSPVGLPVIKITELKYGLSLSTSLYSGEYKKKYLLNTGDLLFAWSGNPETSLDAFRWKGKKALLNQHIFRVVPHNNIDKTYLFFLLKYLKPTFIRTARDKATSMGHVKVSDLQRLIAFIPPLPEQKAIASILGTLDDKIELNRKMNETLEAMAKAIFKNWFVDFDPIPGLSPHKKRQDSPLGKIPKGWSISKIEDLAERVAMGPFGSSIKVSTFVPYGIPVISGQHLHDIMLHDESYNFITHEHAEKLKNANVFRGDVIFTHAGNIGQVAFIPPNSQYERYVLSQRQFYMRCNLSRVSPSYIVHFFKTTDGQHNLLANTSTTGVPSISRPVTFLRSIQIPVPPKVLIDAFDKFVHPIHLQIRSNIAQSKTLAILRDALLPKLLSGEIRVKDAERFGEGKI